MRNGLKYNNSSKLVINKVKGVKSNTTQRNKGVILSSEKEK